MIDLQSTAESVLTDAIRAFARAFGWRKFNALVDALQAHLPRELQRHEGGTGDDRKAPAVREEAVHALSGVSDPNGGDEHAAGRESSE